MEDFRPVMSHRCWRRVAALWRPVPLDLVGKCFNFFAGDHVKADCMSHPRCFNCKGDGHQERDYPFPSSMGRGGREAETLAEPRTGSLVGHSSASLGTLCVADGHHLGSLRLQRKGALGAARL